MPSRFLETLCPAGHRSTKLAIFEAEQNVKCRQPAGGRAFGWRAALGTASIVWQCSHVLLSRQVKSITSTRSSWEGRPAASHPRGRAARLTRTRAHPTRSALSSPWPAPSTSPCSPSSQP
eukprot:3904691-Pleurochrysis_carterae.AAC.1